MSSDRPSAAHDVLNELGPVEGEVSTSALIAMATEAGASARVIETLQRLPERVWSSVEDAAAAVETGRRPRT
jgi:hypothetical protein